MGFTQPKDVNALLQDLQSMTSFYSQKYQNNDLTTDDAQTFIDLLSHTATGLANNLHVEDPYAKRLNLVKAQNQQLSEQELIQSHRSGKHICLVCFCTDETLCHRSILAGVLQANDIAVQGVKNNYTHLVPDYWHNHR